MILTATKIEEKIYAEFHKYYKAFGGFVNSGSLWQSCISAIHDIGLINNIIFCNDIHQIPPVHTFLKVCSANISLTELEKRSVGAFWGFVFKFVFEYHNQKSVTARVNTVRTATYFYDRSEKVIVVQQEGV